MSKPTAVILLCEDYRQSSLILKYLKKCGIQRDIRPHLSPKGAGSAEQWVVQQYPIEVNAYRLAKARKQTWLIVVLDADTGTVSRRIAQLDAGMAQAEDLRLRQVNPAQEAIGRLIARRNIETWILALTGETVNETSDYKHKRSSEEWVTLIPPASARLYEWTRVNAALPDPLIASLRRGVHELRRLETMGR